MSAGRGTIVDKRAISIRAPIGSVWAVLTDIDGWSRWNPDISRSRLRSSLGVGGVFLWKAGGVPIASKIQAYVPERMIEWTGRALGIRARHVWHLKWERAETLVLAEESMDGWLVRLLRPWMGRKLERSHERWLAALKRECEGRAEARSAS